MSVNDQYLLLGLLVTIIGFFVREEWLEYRQLKRDVCELIKDKVKREKNP